MKSNHSKSEVPVGNGTLHSNTEDIDKSSTNYYTEDTKKSQLLFNIEEVFHYG